DGELIGVEAVGAPDDEIADIAREILCYRSLQAVAEFHARGVDAHASRPLRTSAPIRGQPVATGSGIDALAAGTERSRIELAPRARAIVDVGVRSEPIERGGVESRACRLPHDLAVPGESIAFECREDRSLRVALRTRHVDV